MFKKKESKKAKIFKGFLLSYILILILPFAFGSFVYYKAMGIIEKDTKDARIFMLKQSNTIINNYLKDLDKTVISIALDPNINTTLYMNQPEYGSSDVYYVAQTQQKFRSFNPSSSFNSSLYIYLKQSDMVMTQFDTNFGIKDYYVNNFNGYNLSFNTWNKRVLDTNHQRDIDPANTLVSNGTSRMKKTYLTYVQSLPLGGTSQKINGTIVVLIDAGDIDKLLGDVDESKTGYTYIVDKNGKVITGVSNDKRNAFPKLKIDPNSDTGFFNQKIDGVDMAVIYTKSSYNGWTYITALPTQVFMDKAIYIKKVIVSIVIITLLLGICISIYLTRRNIRPIQETMITLRKAFQGELEAGKNEYDFLKNGITKLINTHEEMKESMENQKLMMTLTLISRLLHGEINNTKEVDVLSDHLGIKLKGKRHAAAIIVLNRFPNVVNRESLIEHDINRVIIDNVIKKYIGENCYTYILDADQIALILNYDTDNVAECRKISEDIFINVMKELYETFNINVNFGVGNLYEKIIDLNLSFSEAKITLTSFNEVNVNNSIIWYEDMKKESSEYYYPLELELQLINMAKAGNKNGIEGILEIIYNENFVHRRLTNYMEHNLFFDMRGTIIKTIGEVKSKLDIKGIIASKYSEMDVKDIFDSMKAAYFQICYEVHNKKRSHNNQLLNKLVEYIQSNYISSEVSVCKIAAEFNISESYFSQFFKEQMGETFSEYLEKMRIKRACDILIGKDITVEDTAKLVGYNNAYTFRRAFKRVVGVLPTEYRS